MSCVLLIDDHAMFREGLTLALAQAAPTLQIHSVASGTEALALLHSEPAIMTIMMDYYFRYWRQCLVAAPAPVAPWRAGLLGKPR